MTFYEVVLAIHIAAIIAWLGSGFLVHVLMFRAQRNPDPTRLVNMLEDMEPLGRAVFMPASLVALLAGVVLVIDGPWGFDQLWILIALAGFATTFLIGMLLLGPAGEKVGVVMQREGGLGPESRGAIRRVEAIARLDFVVLVVILLDMVFKPTTDDVGALLVLAAVLAGGVAYYFSHARAAESAEERSPSAVATS